MRQLKISQSITSREAQSLEKYLQEIGKIDLITPEEETKLAYLIKQGDEQALDKLTKANLRFVVSVAKQYQNKGLTLSDLIDEGNLGLMKATKLYDETRGFKFISYAVWWIRQSILDALAQKGRIVRLPLNKVGLGNRIGRAFSSLEQEFEREPTLEEVAQFMDINIKEVEDTLASSQRHTSIDAPQTGDGTSNSTIGDDMASNSFVADPDLEAASLKKRLKPLLDKLKTREKEVIEMYFGLNGKEQMTLEEIAYRLNRTRESARQLYNKGIARITRLSSGLEEYRY